REAKRKARCACGAPAPSLLWKDARPVMEECPDALKSAGAGRMVAALKQPHPEEARAAGRLEGSLRDAMASCFETRCFATLLSMRNEDCPSRTRQQEKERMTRPKAPQARTTATLPLPYRGFYMFPMHFLRIAAAALIL